MGKKNTLDLVYNPTLPKDNNFSLAPEQKALERDYKIFLKNNHGIYFSSLLVLNNFPVGRYKNYLRQRGWEKPYLTFLEEQYNEETLPYLMCKDQLSIDYEGNVYDCDFNQMEDVPALVNGKPITIVDLLEGNSLDGIDTIQTRSYCFACTAGSGASCGGALIPMIN